MFGKIKLLSQQTINQIAAGEVIENPASVVKELIENAVDADATRIIVEIKGGGLQLIRVSDDGCGMSKEDALLSLERHATSKIQEVHDLFTLRTMGFRGEALSSIGAISKMTLMTAIQEGTKVEVEGGLILETLPCARTRGTTIEVQSLFYNVPARKKFQKSSTLCGMDVHKVVATMSLAHPEIEFELINQEQKVFSSSGVAGVLGKEFLASAYEINVANERFSIKGYLGSPIETRTNRTGQHLFVNRRPVFSNLISFAVKDGYGTRLDANRFPVFLLHLEIDPKLVDVNVHPQKREVRLQDEALIREKIKEAVAFSLDPSGPVKFEPFSNVFSETSTLSFREEAFVATPSLPLKTDSSPIGLFQHYLLLDEGDGILLVDLLAVQELLAFRSLTKKEGAISQGLLLPIHVELSPVDAKMVQAHLAEIEKMGFSLRSIGKNAFLVDAAPPFLDPFDMTEALLKMSHSEEMPKILARFARTQKRNFMLQEALALWNQIDDKRVAVFLSRDDLAKFFAK